MAHEERVIHHEDADRGIWIFHVGFRLFDPGKGPRVNGASGRVRIR